MGHQVYGNTFAVTVRSSLGTTNPAELVTLRTSGKRARLRELILHRITTGEIVSDAIEIWRGSSGNAGGSVAGIAPMMGWSGAPDGSEFAATGNSSAVATTTGVADRVFVAATSPDGLRWCPEECVAPVVAGSQLLQVIVPAPSAAFAYTATLIFESLGKVPGQ